MHASNPCEDHLDVTYLSKESGTVCMELGILLYDYEEMTPVVLLEPPLVLYVEMHESVTLFSP